MEEKKMEKGKRETLYRKYRPKNWYEVIGQESVTSVLQREAENGQFPHAYLFSGSRGTGKTSVARIFAKAIGTEERDIYEIDAASNRRIEDIRELRQSIRVLPFSSKYKVYIIDEVHMLTKEAFNALLKSLEEPPAHVIFILATTEQNKLPDTIISRCEVFSFKKPNQQMLKGLVVAVAKKEGKAIEPGAAELIALLGNGAYRDTLGTLQKVLSASRGKDITTEEVSEITGAPDIKLVDSFLGAMAKRNLEESLLAVSEAKASNKDIQIFLRLALQKLRAVLLLRFAPDMKKMLEADYLEEEFAFLEKLSGDKEMKINSKLLSELLLALSQMKDSYLPELPLELALVRLFGQNDVQAEG